MKTLGSRPAVRTSRATTEDRGSSVELPVRASETIGPGKKGFRFRKLLWALLATGLAGVLVAAPLSHAHAEEDDGRGFQDSNGFLTFSDGVSSDKVEFGEGDVATGFNLFLDNYFCKDGDSCSSHMGQDGAFHISCSATLLANIAEVIDPAGTATPFNNGDEVEIVDFEIYRGDDLACEPGTFAAIDISKTAFEAGTSNEITEVELEQTFDYGITVESLGPDTAFNVVLTDALPAGVSFSSVSPGACSHSGGTVTCTIGNLATGSSFTATITVTVDATAECGSTIDNIAVADGLNVAEVQDNAAVSVDCPPDPDPAEIAIEKTASTSSVELGDTFSYEVQVSSLGPGAAEGVVLTDPLPAGVGFVSVSPESDCGESGGSVTCNIGDMAGGTSFTATITVSVDDAPALCGETINNVASADGDNVDPVQDDAVVGVECDAGITIVKTASESSVEPGGTFTYGITVSSKGPDTALDVVLTDPLPAGVSFVSVTPEASCSEAGGTVSCDIGSLAAGADFTATITVSMADSSELCGTTLNNVAEADGSNVPPVQDGADVNVVCEPELSLEFLEGLCVQDAPYADYVISASGFDSPPTLTIRWIIIEDGSNDVAETLTGQPLSGRLLWPGAEVDADGNGIAWPGWVFVPGEGFVEVPTNLRPDMLIEFEANPKVSGIVTYPPSSPTCDANPGGEPEIPEPLVVPVNSPIGLALMALMLMGLAGWVIRRRQRVARG